MLIFFMDSVLALQVKFPLHNSWTGCSKYTLGVCVRALFIDTHFPVFYCDPDQDKALTEDE